MHTQSIMVCCVYCTTFDNWWAPAWVFLVLDFFDCYVRMSECLPSHMKVSWKAPPCPTPGTDSHSFNLLCLFILLFSRVCVRARTREHVCVRWGTHTYLFEWQPHLVCFCSWGNPPRSSCWKIILMSFRILVTFPSAMIFIYHGPWLPLGMAWYGAYLFLGSSFQTYSF